ncbi:hypothetical protein [Pontimicrobium sp. SW4]|uniref:DUF922 domain-containing protein n=1 Tax=Pontimicrobium sp. SW4 TaxID=3153519 RepID=A0AAU7BUX9_9FLAO
MLKKFFIITILIFTDISPIIIDHSLDLFERQDLKDEILWSSNKKLTWNDFLGEPNNYKENLLAETQCEIKIIGTYRSGGIPKYIIASYFIKSKSWTKVNDSLTLKHEQVHFDIYELFTRKIRKEFDKLNKKKVRDTKMYDEIYYKLVNESINLNDRYDNEVYFNNEKQQIWIEEIAVELENLKEYSFDNHSN